MKLLVCGSDEITSDYRFIAEDEDYNFKDLLDELVEGIETTADTEVKFLTKGSNSGVDAIINIYCSETGVELEEKDTNNKLVEDDAKVLRNAQLANECDAGIIFYIRYQKFKGTELDSICNMLEERGKPVYLFPMEKYS